jgi:hypothetical protein
MTDGSTNETYDSVLFKVLALEVGAERVADTERQIKRKLRRLALGPYDQDRVDYARSLKCDLQTEIGLFHKSSYYLGPVGTPADFDKFDFARMVADFGKKYPKVGELDMKTMVAFALYAYYLR